MAKNGNLQDRLLDKFEREKVEKQEDCDYIISAYAYKGVSGILQHPPPRRGRPHHNQLDIASKGRAIYLSFLAVALTPLLIRHKV